MVAVITRKNVQVQVNLINTVKDRLNQWYLEYSNGKGRVFDAVGYPHTPRLNTHDLWMYLDGYLKAMDDYDVYETYGDVKV